MKPRRSFYASQDSQQYIDRIDAAKSNVWIDGQQVQGNVSEHPAFRGVMRSQAALYDMQFDPGKIEIMTYVSPTTGERVGTSFLQPSTREDLEKRRNMIQEWAKFNGGMMGRSPDYINSGMMAYGAAADIFGAQDTMYADNMRQYIEYIRENDLSLTHTLIQPQVNRGVQTHQLSDPYIAARIVRKNDDGVVIRGARLLATQGGIRMRLWSFRQRY